MADDEHVLSWDEIREMAWGDDDPPLGGGVYGLFNPEELDEYGNEAEPDRTGRTKDLRRRAHDHKRGQDTRDLIFRTFQQIDNPRVQRGLEHALYQKYENARGLNLRDPLDRRARDRREVIEETRDYLETTGDKLDLLDYLDKW